MTRLKGFGFERER